MTTLVSQQAIDAATEIYNSFLAVHPIELLNSDRANHDRRIAMLEQTTILVQEAIDKYVDDSDFIKALKGDSE